MHFETDRRSIFHFEINKHRWSILGMSRIETPKATIQITLEMEGPKYLEHLSPPDHFT
jgi:hypothetical protein